MPLRRAGFDVTFEGLSLLGSFPDRIVPLSTWRGLDTSGQTVAISPVGSGGIRARFPAAPGGPIGGFTSSGTPLPPPLWVSSTRACPRAAAGRGGLPHLSARVVGTPPGLP